MKNQVIKKDPFVGKSKPRLSVKKKRILIVHASEEMRELMTVFLKSTGHHLFMAGTSEEALQILEKTKPDLLITNIVLSDLHGGELIIKVRMKWPPKKLKMMIVSSMSLGKAFMTRYHVICRLQPPLEMHQFIQDIQCVLDDACPESALHY